MSSDQDNSPVPAADLRQAWSLRLDAAATREDRGVIHYRMDGTFRFQSYAALRAEAECLLGGLQEAGVAVGTHVVLQLPGSESFLPTLWACLLGGYVAVPVLRPPTYEQDGSVRRKVLTACQTLNGAVVVAEAGDHAPLQTFLASESCAPRLLAYETLAAAAPGQRVASTPDRVALMMFTSGSTGAGKGVPLTEGNLLAMAGGTVAMNDFHVDDVALNWMAADHVGAVSFLGLVPVDAGCSQVQVPTDWILMKPTRWLDLISQHRASISWAPNFAFSLVLENEEAVRAGDWDLSSMRFLVNAGEPIVARTARRFLEVMESRGLPADALRPAFGMSETCSGITWSRGFTRVGTTDDQQFVSLGPTIPGAEMRIVNAAGETVADGESGRLQMRGSSVFSGYHNRPELNAEVLDAEGWFTTGDLAYLRDGELYITGREKDVIIVNGANFYSHEIEGVAEEVEGVRTSFTAACGVRSAEAETEQLALFFVPDEGANAQAVAKAIRAAVVQRVGVAAHFVVALEEAAVPKTEIGKIKRPQLKASFERGDFAAAVVLRPAGERKAAPRVARRPRLNRRSLQRDIAAIWGELLGLDEVGLDETFFELGGHSLLVVQVQQQLSELIGREVTVAELFSHATVNQLANHFARDLQEEDDDATAASRAAAPPRASRGVAVIGIGCRFPGADGPQAFWENLEAGRESIRFFTAEDAIAAGVDPALVRDPSFVRAAPVLDGVEDFDAGFFKYSAKEASLIDPQQRLFLETCWEAFEDAGYDPLTTTANVGLYAAAGLNTYLANNLLADPTFLAEENGGRLLTVDSMGGFNVMITNDKDYLTTRVAYKLNLRGPVVNLQSACSSTLLAVHQACRALVDGECEMALAGGVSIKLPQFAGHQYSAGMLNSPDGHCRAYDAKAEGTIFGNGSGAVLLKRVEDAVADGDDIYAVVLGSATNNDGGDKVGYTAPSADGEYRVMRDAIARSGVHAETITYVEGHGTGTPLGDPIEIDALTRAFREQTDRKQYCAVGSVKTNIGHMQIASGIAGFIKTALALKHARLPATLHYEEANPQIDFPASPFFVSNQTTDWQTDGMPRRAGVNSLGIGGSNVHVILEEAPRREAATLPTPADPLLLPLSAAHEAALRELARRHADALAQLDDRGAAELCHTVRSGRAEFEWRRAFVAADRPALIAALREWADATDEVPARAHSADELRLAFLVSGQGAQRPGMGQELAARFPVFAVALDRCAAVLDPLLPAPLRDVLWPSDEAGIARLNQTAQTQPALFAYAYALGELYRSWGIEPEGALGHSVGEYVGAVWAGVMSVEDALRVVAARGRLMQDAPGSGAMLAVDLPAEDLTPHLDAELVIAGYNGRRQTVVAGPTDRIEKLQPTLSAADVKCTRLAVSHAFHSPLMEPAARELAQVLANIDLQSPAMELVSNVTGVIEHDGFTDAAYWSRHLREPVRYGAGIEALLDQGYTAFIEMGPKPVLTGMNRREHGSERAAWIASARGDGGEVLNLLRALGAYFEHGGSLHSARLAADLGGQRRHGTPTYPWQRQRYWIEGTDITQRSTATKVALPAAADPFLGRPLRLPRSRERVFEQSASVAGMPWVTDHLVHGAMVAPGAQLLAQVLSAGEKVGAGQPFTVDELTFAAPLVIAAGQAREAQLVLAPTDNPAQWELEVLSFAHQDDEPVVHATAQLSFATMAVPQIDGVDLTRVRRLLPESGNVNRHHETMAKMGIDLGPSFQWIQSIARDGQDRALVELRAPEAASIAAGWHPGLLDCALQSLVAAMPDAPGSMVPFRLRRVTWWRGRSATGGMWATARWDRAASEGQGRWCGDVTLYDEAGQPCVRVEGFELRAISAEDVSRSLRPALSDSLWQTQWEPWTRVAHDATASLPAGEWLILANTPAAGDHLVNALTKAGQAARSATALPDDLTPLAGVIDVRGTEAPAMAPRTAWLAAQRWFARDATQPYLFVTQASVVPEAAAVTALWRALNWERPGALLRSLVVASTAGWEDRVAADLALLVTAPGEVNFALHEDSLQVARLERLPGQRMGAEAVVRPDGSYLITGGWGALGLEVAGWLIERGARHLVLNGRSQPGEAAEAEIAAWREQGVAVETLAGDISDAAVVARLVEAASAQAPLRGVVHAAGVLHDQLLPAMSAEDFETVWRTKAGGARALVEAIPMTSMDFVVFYSSIASAIGSAAQSNYAAANGYLDGLAAQLRAAGHPAVSLRWGPWEERGMSARLEASSRERLRAWGFGGIAPSEARALLGRLFASDDDPVILPLDVATFGAALGAQAPALFERILPETPAAGATDQPRGPDWATMSPEVRTATVKQKVEDALRRILGLPTAQVIAADKGLFDLGIDSLSSVDLKNRLQTALGIKIPATLVFDYPTVTAIVDFLAAKLAPATPAAAPQPSAEADLASLDEDDLEDLLAKELGE